MKNIKKVLVLTGILAVTFFNVSLVFDANENIDLNLSSLIQVASAQQENANGDYEYIDEGYWADNYTYYNGIEECEVDTGGYQVDCLGTGNVFCINIFDIIFYFEDCEELPII